MNAPKRIRVLVVDDSALVRRVITDALSQDPEIEVVGAAADPYIARDMILDLHPDVLTLDIEMPRMDGLTFLKILRKHRPIPVVVVSSLTQTGSRVALEALEAGAVDVLAKPSSAWSIGALAGQLAHRVKGAAAARGGWSQAPAPAVQAPRLTSTIACHPRQLILIGASTGGTEALKVVLPRLPGNVPGICIVQHIPPYFSKALADRLNDLCEIEVREAVQGDEVRPGLALMAPGDYHMSVTWKVDRYHVWLKQGPPIHHTRPAVDVLFNAAADAAGRHAVAALLTGMGRDGALGLKRLQACGATTIAQDEATCVVYGMPRAAVEMGAVDHVLPLEQIPQAIVKCLERRTTPRPVTQPS